VRTLRVLLVRFHGRINASNIRWIIDYSGRLIRITWTVIIHTVVFLALCESKGCTVFRFDKITCD
jgi:hypothetical protein